MGEEESLKRVQSRPRRKEKENKIWRRIVEEISKRLKNLGELWASIDGPLSDAKRGRERGRSHYLQDHQRKEALCSDQKIGALLLLPVAATPEIGKLFSWFQQQKKVYFASIRHLKFVEE